MAEELSRAEFDAVNRAYLEEVAKFPSPTKAEWKRLVRKWTERGANVESLLVYGSAMGWSR